MINKISFDFAIWWYFQNFIFFRRWLPVWPVVCC